MIPVSGQWIVIPFRAWKSCAKWSLSIGRLYCVTNGRIWYKYSGPTVVCSQARNMS